MNKISRKSFLKIAAAAAMSGVTAGALSACNAASGATGTYIPSIENKRVIWYNIKAIRTPTFSVMVSLLTEGF